MITKAIVESIEDKYSLKVRIPYYNKVSGSVNATKVDDLYTAHICTFPNSYANYNIGDIVFLAFEDGYMNKPVVIGQLSRDYASEFLPSINVDSINARIDANLPVNTTIGEVSAQEISYLKGLNENLMAKLEILEQRIAKLEQR